MVIVFLFFILEVKQVLYLNSWVFYFNRDFQGEFCLGNFIKAYILEGYARSSGPASV